MCMCELLYWNRLGGALGNIPNINMFPVMGLDETVHDLTSDQEPSAEPDSPTDTAAGPKVAKVSRPEDIVGARASIVYDECLKSLAAFVSPPVKRCMAITGSGAICGHGQPFLLTIKSRGTASILEWVCIAVMENNNMNVHYMWTLRCTFCSG